MINEIARWLTPSIKSTDEVKKFLPATARQGITTSTVDNVDVSAAYANAVTNGWTYSAIRLLADRLSSQKMLPTLGFDVEDGFEKITDFDLFTESNGLMSWSFSLRYIWWWFFLRGNSYWFIETPNVGMGEPIALWPIIAGFVRPKSDTLREGVGVFSGVPVIDYEYTVGGEITMLSGENIIHLRMPNYSDYWEGLSPLTAANGAIQSDNSQKDWQQQFFNEENGIPSAIISLDKDMDDIDFDAQIMLIKQQLDAGQKRLFTRSGDMKVEVLAQTLEQMQVIQSRQANQTEIYSIYGIPNSIFTATSGEAMKAAELSLSRNTLQPHVDMMASQLSADLAPYYQENNSDRVYFKSPDIIPQDRALAVQEHTIFSQFRSLNETRKELGLPPVENVDTELAILADIPLKLMEAQQNSAAFQRTFTREVGSLIGNQDTGEASRTEAVKTVNNIDETMAALDNVAIRSELKQWRKKAKRIFNTTGDLKAFDFTFSSVPPVMQTAVQMHGQKCTTLEEIEDVYTWGISVVDSNEELQSVPTSIKAIELALDPSDDQTEWEEMRPIENENVDDLQTTFREIAADILKDPTINWSQEDLTRADLTAILNNNPKMKDALEEALTRSATLGSTIGFNQMGNIGIDQTLGFDFRSPFTLASEWARNDVGNLITQIDGTTQQTVRDVVADFFAQETRGQASVEITRALQENIHGLSEQRARTIAITESTRAANAGHTLAYEQVPGLVRKQQWRTVRDEIVSRCPTCAPMEGQITELRHPWIHPVTGRPITIPGHPNCRCRSVGIVEEQDLEAVLEAQRNEGI